MQKVRLAALLFITAVLIIGVATWWVSPSHDQGAPRKVAGGTAGKSSRKIESDKPSQPSVIQRMMSGEIPKLTAEQIAAYVESENHSAVSLLAAWSLSQEDDWLKEAADRYPDDPRVAIAMLIKGGANPDNAVWIESLKRNDPGNALGPLFAAVAAFAENNTADALSELSSLETMSHTDPHSGHWINAMTDAYHSAGYSGLAADWAGMVSLPLPLGGLRDLSRSLSETMKTAAESGDRELAESVGKLGMKAAIVVGRLGERDLLITQLVSISMERKMLDQLHIFDLIPGDEKIVVDRLGEMDARIAHIKDMVARQSVILPTLTESEFKQYTRRLGVEGELKAMEWLDSQRRDP